MLRKRSFRTTISMALVLLLMTMSLVLTFDAAGLQAGAMDTLASGKSLQAGAGMAVIDFTGLFDSENGGSYKGFYGIHDDPHARVLLLETNEKVAIVSLELVNCPEEGIDLCKDIVSNLTGTPVENIWVHATHVISTPHFSGVTGITEKQTEMCMTALELAITEAAREAAETFQPAVAGVGTGVLDINENRNLEINGTYYYGLGGDYGESDKDLTVLRVNSAETGDAIGFLLNYAMKPDVVNNTQESVNGRLVSSDAPGYACTYIESIYNAPALYLMGAAADQIPSKTADYYVADANGDAVRVELSVADAMALVEELGTIMANKVIDIAELITCDESSQVIALDNGTLEYGNKAGDATLSVDVRVMQIGDFALVGLKPEMNALTGLQLKAASPFGTTMLVSFLDGNQGYMPDAQAYEDNTLEYVRTSFAQGAAEAFADLSVDLLKGLNALSRFTDLETGAWYLDHVKYSLANNLFIGISETEWAPNMDLSRAMFVTALGKFEGVDISQYSTCAFTDVGDSLYYTAYTQWAYERGLVAGVGGGKFEPDRAITRQEIAQIFMVYAAYKGVDITNPDGSAFESFKDTASTSDWAVPAMIWATANGVFNGDNGNLKPVSNTTRAEAASIFRAVIESII